MDEKKLEQTQGLKDQQLEDVSGGSRVTVIDADDGARDTSVLSSASRLASADNTELGAAARCAANSGDDEELDGAWIHFPV